MGKMTIFCNFLSSDNILFSHDENFESNFYFLIRRIKIPLEIVKQRS